MATAFTVCELLREKQHGGGGCKITLPHTAKLGLKKHLILLIKMHFLFVFMARKY